MISAWQIESDLNNKGDEQEYETRDISILVSFNLRISIEIKPSNALLVFFVLIIFFSPGMSKGIDCTLFLSHSGHLLAAFSTAAHTALASGVSSFLTPIWHCTNDTLLSNNPTKTAWTTLLISDTIQQAKTMTIGHPHTLEPKIKLSGECRWVLFLIFESSYFLH